ncbi:MAG: Crp/Fnr family transcriptional regulator [Candidatus Pelethousia sp.]|nr:Crp/Fnr family transcriptional regulator [Candidatus Pelethousia sp.]
MTSLEQLSQHPLFAGTEPVVLRRALEQGAYEKCFAPGQQIRPGELALGLLLAGRAQVTKTAGHTKLRMSELGPGSLLGGATLFGKGRQPTEIRAVVSCQVLFFPQSVFEAMLEADFGLTKRYLGYLTARIRFLTDRIESIACPAAADKLLCHLAQCADETGALRMPGGLDVLAQSLGMSRATLYRSLHALEEAGRIRREGRAIYLLQE